ncbi:OmpW family outer membrane protein [Amaricoccus sp.]|uniref:outer membrane protein n=1 Tax=Amaricoccus sp. TaxID=1872485 RepID=UPI001B3E5F46|nr:OmpW family outer membrane protein [Amaricoccus sp.]MBP7003610.1 outer membrane beta-barrel protein [Amaricoccus sp.]
MPALAKSLLLAATAATAIGAAGAASAQAFDSASLYLKGFGGATFPSGDDESLRTNGQKVGRVDLDYDTGYTLGVALGFTPVPNVGVELEYAYRNVDYDGTARIDGARSDVDGTAKVNAVMVNALYNFTNLPNQQVVPYLGAGIGAAQVDYEGDSSTWNFAYQAIAGLGYEVAPQWTLYGEGRWFGTAESKVWPDKGLATDVSFGTFDLLFGAKYQF